MRRFLASITCGVVLSIASQGLAQKLTTTWTNNADVYNGNAIERKVTGGQYAEIMRVPQGVSQFVDTVGLSYGTSYTYRVRTFRNDPDMVRYSEYSNEATAAPLAPAAVGPMGAISFYSVPMDTAYKAALVYACDENTGTILGDASGNNRPGVITGATWTTGPTGSQYGSALNFTGTAKVTSPLTVHGTQRSYLVWTKRTGPGGGGFGRIFDKHKDDNGVTEVELFYNDETVDPKVYRYFRRWSGGGGSWTIPQPSANTWNHIAVTYDASSPNNNPLIYVNGVSQPVTRVNPPSGSPVANTDPYIIGNRGFNDRAWAGQLDEIGIYDTILTPAQIQAIIKKKAP
jgi:hypothetical protein